MINLHSFSVEFLKSISLSDTSTSFDVRLIFKHPSMGVCLLEYEYSVGHCARTSIIKKFPLVPQSKTVIEKHENLMYGNTRVPPSH